VQENHAVQLAAIQHALGNLAAKVIEHAGTSAGASDAAIAQLATRISAMEKQVASQDMTILDTAEKVTNRLQDRLRKRREAEVPQDDHDEIDDPQAALMRARAFYLNQQPQLPLGDG
jgi:uncharacterized coiled-coil protein SlyX